MIYLVVNVKPFDEPRQYGAPIPLEKQMEIATRGVLRLLEILTGFGVKATFVCRDDFAKARPQIMRCIVRDGHNLVSHVQDGDDFIEIEIPSDMRAILAEVTTVGYDKMKHNLPLDLLKWRWSRELRRSGRLIVGLNSWEFTSDGASPIYRMPWLLRRNAGNKMGYRISSVIVSLKDRKESFGVLSANGTDKLAEK